MPTHKTNLRASHSLKCLTFKSIDFIIFKADLSDKKWIKVNSIGTHTIIFKLIETKSYEDFIVALHTDYCELIQ
jgi:hypothetical protein